MARRIIGPLLYRGGIQAACRVAGRFNSGDSRVTPARQPCLGLDRFDRQSRRDSSIAQPLGPAESHLAHQHDPDHEPGERAAHQHNNGSVQRAVSFCKIRDKSAAATGAAAHDRSRPGARGRRERHETGWEVIRKGQRPVSYLLTRFLPRYTGSDWRRVISRAASKSDDPLRRLESFSQRGVPLAGVDPPHGHP
jgi:hypothetical protein